MLKFYILNSVLHIRFSHLKNLSMLKLAHSNIDEVHCFSHLKNLSMLKFIIRFAKL